MGPQRKVNGINLISRDEGPSKQELSLAWGSPSPDVVEDILSLVKLKQADGAEGSVNITTDRIRNTMPGNVLTYIYIYICPAAHRAMTVVFYRIWRKIGKQSRFLIA